MTHEQLIAKCTQWFWNTYPEERRMLFAVNNNISESLLVYVPDAVRQRIAEREGNKNKAKGVVPGVFDLIYIMPQQVIVMDAKVGKDTLSEEQKDFRMKCLDRGHGAFTFSTFEEFTEIIELVQNG